MPLSQTSYRHLDDAASQNEEHSSKAVLGQTKDLVKSLKRCALGNGGDEQVPHVVFRRITERTHTTYCA